MQIKLLAGILFGSISLFLNNIGSNALFAAPIILSEKNLAQYDSQFYNLYYTSHCNPWLNTTRSLKNVAAKSDMFQSCSGMSNYIYFSQDNSLNDFSVRNQYPLSFEISYSSAEKFLHTFVHEIPFRSFAYTVPMPHQTLEEELSHTMAELIMAAKKHRSQTRAYSTKNNSSKAPALMHLEFNSAPSLMTSEAVSSALFLSSAPASSHFNYFDERKITFILCGFIGIAIVFYLRRLF